MDPLSPQQALQEDEYSFPYHYVVRFRAGFSQAFHDSWAINYASGIELVLDRVKASGARSVVDVGCGDGRLARELSLAMPEAQIVGMDYSRRAIDLARAMNADRPGLRFEAADIVTGTAEQAFDAAVLMEVLEHIPPAGLGAFVGAVRKRVSGRGRLFLTVPHANKPVEAKHFQHFTAASLRAALEPAFRIEEIVPFERGGIRRRLLNALLANRLFILNHPRSLDFLYRWHRDHLFLCDEAACQRLFVQAAPA